MSDNLTDETKELGALIDYWQEVKLGRISLTKKATKEITKELRHRLKDELDVISEWEGNNPNDSFFELMKRSTDISNDCINIPLEPEKFKEIVGNDLSIRVDGLRYWDKKLKDLELGIADEIRIKTARKSTIQNSRKRFRKNIIEIMNENDSIMVQGNQWQVKVSQRKSVKVLPMELTSDHYLKYKSVIKREYSFDVTALKTAYTVNPDEYKDFVEVGVMDVLSFSAFNPVKKGKKDDTTIKN